jgi:hypothetical protein
MFLITRRIGFISRSSSVFFSADDVALGADGSVDPLSFCPLLASTFLERWICGFLRFGGMGS